jgi:two-component system nitrogen regulation response regulator GlnG
MQEVYKRIALAAASDASVLLIGECGTGKQLAARAIHRYGRRADAPFVAASVASLSSSLAESELFGSVRGAFNGAAEDRDGLLIQAKGGTLFLDEVAEIPFPTQVKLLQALEHNEALPIGSNQVTTTDFRVISATNQNLHERTAAGKFRRDLLYRLGAFQIELPPLRERPEDIGELASYFIERLAGNEHQQPARLTTQALAELKNRPWYGNVRELRNAIEHALIMARGGAILPEHLPTSISAPLLVEPAEDICRSVASAVRLWAERSLNDATLAGRVYDELLNVVEPPLLEAAIQRHRGQCATAARTLGIHRTTLRKKLTQHGLADDPGDEI